jgi:anti-sigma regulatory factor (Ser/Thr protein kinase)
MTARGPVTLTVPAEADAVRLARLVVAAVSAAAALAADDVEQLVLAVGEACAALVASAPEGGLRLRIAADVDGVRVDVAAAGPTRAIAADPLREVLLHALVDEVATDGAAYHLRRARR